MTREITVRADPEIPNEFVDLLRKVDKDNPSKDDIEKLWSWLEERPDLGLAVANLADFAKDMIIHQTPFKQESVKMCLEAGTVQLQNDMGYQEAQPLERMLIENIIICWLRLQAVEIGMSNNTKGSHTLSEGRYWDQRLSAAQMRYLRAIETLARVRKANIAIQVNIARQQINTL